MRRLHTEDTDIVCSEYDGPADDLTVDTDELCLAPFCRYCGNDGTCYLVDRCGYEHSLQEIGDDIGLTRERIRQLQVAALRKLRFRVDESLCEDLQDTTINPWDELEAMSPGNGVFLSRAARKAICPPGPKQRRFGSLRYGVTRW